MKCRVFLRICSYLFLSIRDSNLTMVPEELYWHFKLPGPNNLKSLFACSNIESELGDIVREYAHLLVVALDSLLAGDESDDEIDKVNARRSVDSPRYHLITTPIIR